VVLSGNQKERRLLERTKWKTMSNSTFSLEGFGGLK